MQTPLQSGQAGPAEHLRTPPDNPRGWRGSLTLLPGSRVAHDRLRRREVALGQPPFPVLPLQHHGHPTAIGVFVALDHRREGALGCHPRATAPSMPIAIQSIAEGERFTPREVCFTASPEETLYDDLLV